MDSGRGRSRGVVKKHKQNNNAAFYVVVAVVAIAGIGALTYVSTRSSGAAVSPIDTTLPPVKSEGYVLGSPTARIEVIEFADFECPACGQFAVLTEPDVRSRLINTGQMRLRFIDFPLAMHANTWNASRAAACAADQGKFWEMHDLIFQNQDRWNTQATNDPDDVLKDLGGQLGIDTDRFDECVDSKQMQAKIQAHLKIAEARNVNQTPSFIIGGKLYPGARPFDDFKQLVDQAIAEAGTQPGPLTPSIGGDTAAGVPLGSATATPAPRQ